MRAPMVFFKGVTVPLPTSTSAISLDGIDAQTTANTQQHARWSHYAHQTVHATPLGVHAGAREA